MARHQAGIQSSAFAPGSFRKSPPGPPTHLPDFFSPFLQAWAAMTELGVVSLEPPYFLSFLVLKAGFVTHSFLQSSASKFNQLLKILSRYM
jgi:hypothetical protein